MTRRRVTFFKKFPCKKTPTIFKQKTLAKNGSYDIIRLEKNIARKRIMYSLLLVFIYIAFVGLGLPDSLLGSAWPVIQGELGVPLSYAGIVTMIISFGTVISSLLSDKIIKKFSAGLVTTVSVLTTAIALFGFSISKSFVMLCLWAIPYGLGAGAVDAALNNYVSVHYSSRHMSWLHAFWGVGAAISPYIMSYCLVGGFGWNNGYFSVSVIQIVITVMLFCSLPIWKKKAEAESNDSTENAPELTFVQKLRIPGVFQILLLFFAYCALEQTAGLWASSYLVNYRGVDADTAAAFASMYFIGITLGRFLCGFVADRLGDKMLIRIGIAVSAIGVVMIALPLGTNILALAGLIVAGVGSAPIYPSGIHSTPANFGKANSQAIIGLQMAFAYIGTTLMPPLFGLIATHISIALYPFYLLAFSVIMVIASESLNKIMKKKK